MFIDFFLFLSVWAFYLSIHMCTTCMPDACGGQKRTLEPLDLELEFIAIMQVLRTECGTSASTANAHNHWAISPDSSV